MGHENVSRPMPAIEESLDKPAITTDVIAGFPGETEDELNKHCRLVARRVFKYMPFALAGVLRQK